MKPIEVSVDYGGRKLSLQTGKLAKQADASILATYGETMVLVTVVASKEVKEGQDFFPLTVDYQEKYYSAGRIPGGFFKREAKPSDRATLSARLIDRPCRPLFPEDFLCDTNVVATVLSTDGTNEPDVVASIAASAALHISDIPFGGPVATCRVGLKNGEFHINIPPAEAGDSDCELLVSGVRTGVIMVEGNSKEISEKVMIDAIDAAHKAMQPIFDMQDELREKVGKEKRDYPKPPRNKELKEKMRKESASKLKEAFAIREKLARYEALTKLKKDLKAKFEIAEPKNKEEKAHNGLISLYFEELKSEYARELTLSSKHRIDGRAYNAIRSIACETNLLPRVHGSALFTRGETQVLGTVTLGTSDDEQKIDSINGNFQKTFMLHYNFPPFSVGEARPLRPPGRREIGHGFLAERALSYVIPPKEVFPYTIRLVSEVLESNGSSSMATVCSGSMALMDAGVPIPKPVAGVAMGLIKEGERYAVLSDILGDEDHLGDMDFKVCGTQDGITAFQMDLKIGGVSREIMEEALEQAREGRLHVLEKMNEAISEPKKEFSPYAPRIFTIKVKPEKVREVIGSGGKVIRSIIERTGVKIDIEDDGTVNIASADNASAQKAIDIINQIIAEPEIGRVYEGKVTRIADFGAFVEILPGTDGLCHISELEHFRVRRVEDVVKEGDVIKVKCLDVDSQGKIRLSRKALLPKGGGDAPPSPTRTEEVVESAVEGGDLPGVEATVEAAATPAPANVDADDDDFDNFGNRADLGGRTPRFERSNREPRFDRGGGSREGRGSREPRESRDSRDTRGHREPREPRGHGREPRERADHRSDRPERGNERPRGGVERGFRDRGEGRSDRDSSRLDRAPRDRDRSLDREPRSDRGGRSSHHRDREPRMHSDRHDRGNERGLDRGERGGFDRPARSSGRSDRDIGDRDSSRRSSSSRPSAGRDRDSHSPRRESGGRSHRDEEPRSSSRGGSGSGRFARFERGDLTSRKDLRFDRDEERLPDFEVGSRRFVDDDE